MRTKTTKRPKLSEAAIERTCSDLLAWDGWRVLKTNPCSDRARGKGFGELGMADCLYIRYDYAGQISTVANARASVMWIEWKRAGGKHAPHQMTWQLAERSRGALVLCAGDDFPATLEGFQAWYLASGLQRRQKSAE